MAIGTEDIIRNVKERLKNLKGSEIERTCPCCDYCVLRTNCKKKLRLNNIKGNTHNCKEFIPNDWKNEFYVFDGWYD